MKEENVYNAWQQLTKDASEDGLICDIRIQHLTIDDWNNFLILIANNFKYEFHHKEKEEKLPINIDKSIFEDELATFIELDFGKFVIESVFLLEDTLELTVNPFDIKDNDQFNLLCVFLKQIGLGLRKEISICLEGNPNPYIKFLPTENEGQFRSNF